MLSHCRLPNSSALLGASRLRQEGCLPGCGGRQGGVLGAVARTGVTWQVGGFGFRMLLCSTCLTPPP